MNRLRIPLLLLAWLGLGTAWAAGLPPTYPPGFQHAGLVDQIDAGHGRIVINDLGLTLAHGVRVHTPRGRSGGLTLLRPGQRVGCTLRGQNQPVVTDIWILPAGAAAIPPRPGRRP